ncbi:MAG: HAMP domain-containing histidine kinase, partial [Hyphomonadaceae bacterium]|nr:HAMP domain-containing histidine kinase [Hyphomonadaceae bacterium]
RTPLQTIQGYSEILQAQLHGPLNSRQGEQVEVILSAADALSKLVDNILDIAMLDAGRLELDLAPVDLGGLLQEVAGLIEAKARAVGVTVRLEIDRGLGPIQADDKRIRQILFNLLSNALRFTDREDVITLGAARADGEVRLWVADTGRGMPLDTQAGVFGNFVSGDKRGAGLGLALARSLVELHGGWIALESEPGKGATITCHLPVVAASAAA